MAGRTIDIEWVADVKKRLWDGETTTAIGTDMKSAQSTIWRVKEGHDYGDIPWPDGSLGPLPDERRLEIKRLRKVSRTKSADVSKAQMHYDRVKTDSTIESGNMGKRQSIELHREWLGRLSDAIEDDNRELFERYLKENLQGWEVPDFARKYCARFGIDPYTGEVKDEPQA